MAMERKSCVSRAIGAAAVTQILRFPPVASLILENTSPSSIEEPGSACCIRKLISRQQCPGAEFVNEKEESDKREQNSRLRLQRTPEYLFGQEPTAFNLRHNTLPHTLPHRRHSDQ